jgi:hypothetical protein
LRRQLYLQYQYPQRPDMEDQLIELEAAITQIESDAAQEVPLPSQQRDAMSGATTRRLILGRWGSGIQTRGGNDSFRPGYGHKTSQTRADLR